MVCQGSSGEAKSFTGGNRFGSFAVALVKFGDLCHKWGKMRPNTVTVPVWDGVSLRELTPGVDQGFALWSFPFNLVLATSLQKSLRPPLACG